MYFLLQFVGWLLIEPVVRTCCASLVFSRRMLKNVDLHCFKFIEFGLLTEAICNIVKYELIIQ